MKSICTTLAILLVSQSLWAFQTPPPRKPVLIRDDVEESFDEVPLPDPDRSREALKIGKYYFKRKNYKAAASRFREAMRYLPQWPEPYERLAESLWKMKAYDSAQDICLLFVATNPESTKVKDFEALSARIKKDAGTP